MAKIRDQWQDVDTVLALFGKQKYAARKKYRVFVEKGISEGKKSELTGGGLIRSAGCRGVLKSLRRMDVHFKSDERILGDSDFVERVAAMRQKRWNAGTGLEQWDTTLTQLLKRVSETFRIAVKYILLPGKQPERVMARSVSAYWSVRELGVSGTTVGKRLGLNQSAVSRAVQRGEQLVSEHRLSLYDTRNA